MSWIPAVVWGAAVVVAAVVLGFAGYEIWWKAGRLQADLRRLSALADELRAVQRDLAAAQHRVTRPAAAPDPDR